MKRSEMIKILHDCMRDNHYGQYGEFNKMAKDILNRIEEAGMLPPNFQYNEFDCVPAKDMMRELNIEDMGHFCWEEEND